MFYKDSALTSWQHPSYIKQTQGRIRMYTHIPKYIRVYTCGERIRMIASPRLCLRIVAPLVEISVIKFALQKIENKKNDRTYKNCKQRLSAEWEWRFALFLPALESGDYSKMDDLSMSGSFWNLLVAMASAPILVPVMSHFWCAQFCDPPSCHKGLGRAGRSSSWKGFLNPP